METVHTSPDWTQIAEIELAYKTHIKPSMRPTIRDSKDSYDAFIQHWNPDKIEFVEQFKVLLLNRANKILGIYEVSSGSVSMCIADPKNILCAAIKANASSIILCHNHPSGNTKPSQADQTLTQKMKTAASYLDISLLDHLVITTENYFSFADEGLL